jgi:hypothetical protein
MPAVAVDVEQELATVDDDGRLVPTRRAHAIAGALE